MVRRGRRVDRSVQGPHLAQSGSKEALLGDQNTRTASGDDMPPAGMIGQELGLLDRLGVVALERTGPQPTQIRCALRDDGVFAELSELAARARDATLAG